MRASEQDLVRQAKAGDEAACHEIVERFGAYLHRLAFSLVGNAADAEDVVQESFAGAFRGLRDFEERASLKTWLSGIAVRQAARFRQQRSRHFVVSLDAKNEAGNRGPAARGERDADARLDIMAVLQELSEEHRAVIVLREMQGMAYDEMAQALNVPRGTIESRLFRARQELKERLKDYLP